MGRELKKVPLDFNWPIEKVWEGYINPYKKEITECSNCNGSGISTEARFLQDKWYGYVPFKPEDRDSTPFIPTEAIIQKIVKDKWNNPYVRQYTYCFEEEFMKKESERLCKLWNKAWMHHLNNIDIAILIAHNRLGDFTHIYTKNGWQPKDPPYIPTAREVNEWGLTNLGHDCINCYLVVKAECERLHQKYTCSECEGKGYAARSDLIKKDIEEAHANWKPVKPPIGEGFQLWETTSEGSPMTPVFKSLKELCRWCADNVSVFADKKVTAEEWKKMLENGLVYNKEGNVLFI